MNDACRTSKTHEARGTHEPPRRETEGKGNGRAEDLADTVRRIVSRPRNPEARHARGEAAPGSMTPLTLSARLGEDVRALLRENARLKAENEALRERMRAVALGLDDLRGTVDPRSKTLRSKT